MPMPFWKYRPYDTVDLPDRTWPDAVVDAGADLVLDRPARREPGARQPDGLRRASGASSTCSSSSACKEIEVGFPAASKTDFDFVPRPRRGGARSPTTSTIAVLTQARPELIERTYEALEGARARDRPPLQLDVGRRSAASSSGSTATGITELAVRGTTLCKELAAGDRHGDRLPVLARELPPHGARLRARDLRGRGRGVGADAGREDDRQPADDGRGVPAERLRRPDGVVRPQLLAAATAIDPLASTRTTTGARPSPRRSSA